MGNPRPEEEKIYKDIRNLFRLKKERHKKCFFLKKNKNKVIKDIVLRGIKNLLEFKKEKENY